MVDVRADELGLRAFDSSLVGGENENVVIPPWAFCPVGPSQPHIIVGSKEIKGISESSVADLVSANTKLAKESNLVVGTKPFSNESQPIGSNCCTHTFGNCSTRSGIEIRVNLNGNVIEGVGNIPHLVSVVNGPASSTSVGLTRDKDKLLGTSSTKSVDGNLHNLHPKLEIVSERLIHETQNQFISGNRVKQVVQSDPQVNKVLSGDVATLAKH